MQALKYFAGICITFSLFAAFTLPFLNVAHADPPRCDEYDKRGCATGGFVPLENFSGSPRLSDAYRAGELKDFLNKIFVGAIALGALLAVLRLAWAGFEYLASDLWSTKEHAKEIIRETLLGLFLLLAIWVILNQINPQILELKLNVGSSSVSGSGSSGASSPFVDSDAERATKGGGLAPSTPDSRSSGPDLSKPLAPLTPDSRVMRIPRSAIPPGAWCFSPDSVSTYNCYFDKSTCDEWASGLVSAPGRNACNQY